QDIGGVRAIVANVAEVRTLETVYATTPFQHKNRAKKDYITNPKPDGYRGVHLIYEYKNDQAPQYNGLLIELQIRTRTQHIWSTAVETMGTFLGQSLKSQQGDDKWLTFFSIVSAAFALEEGCKPGQGFEDLSASD